VNVHAFSRDASTPLHPSPSPADGLAAPTKLVWARPVITELFGGDAACRRLLSVGKGDIIVVVGNSMTVSTAPAGHHLEHHIIVADVAPGRALQAKQRPATAANICRDKDPWEDVIREYVRHRKRVDIREIVRWGLGIRRRPGAYPPLSEETHMKKPSQPRGPAGTPKPFTGDVKEEILKGLNAAHPGGILGFLDQVAREDPRLAGRARKYAEYFATQGYALEEAKAGSVEIVNRPPPDPIYSAVTETLEAALAKHSPCPTKDRPSD
jgi:hypothetical protein